MLSIRSLWLNMKGMLRLARQMINAGLEPLNLSSAEGDILFHLLTGSNNLAQEKIAFSLDIGKAAVSRAVDSLEAKGYVARMRQKDDRRAYCISLTDKALSARAEIEGIYNRLYDLVRDGIAEDELISIEAVLSRVAENLQAKGAKSCFRN